MKFQPMGSLLLSGLLLAALPVAAMAQGFGQGNFDPAQIRQFIQQRQQQQLDDIKSRMGASDDEFAVLGPKIQNIMQLELTSQTVRIGAFLPRQFANLNLTGDSPSALQTATAELQAAVADSTTNDQIIANKLAAVRAERQKITDKLNDAQHDLIQLLTQKQEAVLVLMGIVQ